jgi:hypothetical protein
MTALPKRIVVGSFALLLTPACAGAQEKALKSEPPVADDAQSVLAESVGLITGLQLYQTYLNIGLLADGMSEGIYEPKEVFQLLGSVVHPLDRVEKQLDKIAKLKLPKDDIAALARMKKILGLLRQEGKELHAFWETGKPENGKKYEEIRQAAWKEIDALLELDPKDEKLPPPRPTPEKKP